MSNLNDASKNRRSIPYKLLKLAKKKTKLTLFKSRLRELWLNILYHVHALFCILAWREDFKKIIDNYFD